MTVIVAAPAAIAGKTIVLVGAPRMLDSATVTARSISMRFAMAQTASTTISGSMFRTGEAVKDRDKAP